MQHRVYTSPEELDTEMNRFFSDCEKHDLFPDRADMIIYLGLSLDTYDMYVSNPDGIYDGYAEVLKKARLRREGWLTRAMFADKKATPAMFLLKQTCNGGYAERPVTESTLQLEIKINGENSNQFD